VAGAAGFQGSERFQRNDSIVRPRFSGWLLPATALPATLIGHALAYNLAGRSQADGHHGYFVQALEYSTILLGGLCVLLIARALTRRGWVVPRFGSLATTWIKLSVLQIAMFAVLERMEGYVPALVGCAEQALVALCAALALSYFARVLNRCEHGAADAERYLRRLRLSLLGRHISRSPYARAYALSVRVGPSRFARPPPKP
jgi:hypothetical protein